MWIMMNKKLTTMLFSLLLAVGWTTGASAQRLPADKVKAARTMELNQGNPRNIFSEATPNYFKKEDRLNAPNRSQNFNSTASAVHDKAWYENLAPVTWTGGSKLLTEPFTDPDGMIALLKRVYTDRTIPGAKYSDAWGCDIPYQTIEYGWNIVGTNYNEGVRIYINSSSISLMAIRIKAKDGTVLQAWYSESTLNLPTGWTTSTNLTRGVWYDNEGDGYYVWHMNQAGYITIPAADLSNTTGYATIEVAAVSTNNTVIKNGIRVGNSTFDYGYADIEYEDLYIYPIMSIPGTITPPDENGYTVMLVKLFDGKNPNDLTNPTDSAPAFTYSEAELRSYFQTYVKEIQLLTGGLRVGEGTDQAGTAFTYSGDLNRFFFIGKGKMRYQSSMQFLPYYDAAPFYSMYEEFSPTSSGATQDEVTDFFDRMRREETYAVQHDCVSVNYLQHYFSMSGKMGTNENPVSNLIFYIPDKRGVDADWRTYNPAHQPQVGMYIIHLDAQVQSIPGDRDHYNVNVTWTSNLGNIAGDTDVPQIYYLFATYEDGTTELLTVDGTDDLSFVHYVDAGDPKGYPISYYVIGMPFVDENNDGINDYTGTNVFDDIDTDFQAQSNTQKVNIPGKNDFIMIDLARYESDYVVGEEVNYYRNFISIENIPATETNGITKDYVGDGIKSLVLLRSGKKVIYLDLKMDGDKCYYRFRYLDQVKEDGYGDDGNLISNP